MSSTQTRKEIQAINRGITGITDAPDAFPVSIPAANLPTALTYLGPGVTRWESHGGDLIRRERTFLVRVYVAAAELGLGITESMEDAEQLLDTFLATWQEQAELADGAQVQITIQGGAVVGIGIRDSGVVHDMVYGDGVYRGFEAQLTLWMWDED
jgi:hypothetical protein